MARTESQPRMQRGLDLLLAGATVPDVAREVGVNRSTVWRWTQEPEFAAQLRADRASRRYAVQEAIHAVALEAVAYMATLVRDEAAPPAVRLKAACALLDRAGVSSSGANAGQLPRAMPVHGVETWPATESRERLRAELGV